MRKPSVLFVCVKNAGKSQMAAGLMRKIAGATVDVYSAGTKPGTGVNALSAECLLEVGVDITGEHPKPLDPELVGDVDIVVTLGNEAHVEPVQGTRFETWDTDEPSERGIDGIDRMRLIRDDITARVRVLAEQLRTASPAQTKTGPNQGDRSMSKVQVFEPALCCATGVCGEDVDQRLVRFSADLDYVRSRGGDVSRYNLASEPSAFAESDTVKAFLHVAGSDGLPLVLVDGVTAMTGRYPDRAQLATWAGIDASGPAGPTSLDITETTTAGGGCCSSDSSGATDCC